MISYQYCINLYLCGINSYRVCYYCNMVFGACIFFLQSNQPGFFLEIPDKMGGGQCRNITNIEQTTYDDDIVYFIF